MRLKINEKMKPKSFRSFIAESGSHYKFVRIPKKILIDKKLTEIERLLWIILACFLFSKDSNIFPSRTRLAKLLGIKDPTYITKLTTRLQSKKYLEKGYGPRNKTFYEIYFDDEVDDSIFDNQVLGRIKPSKNNKITRNRSG